MKYRGNRMVSYKIETEPDPNSLYVKQTIKIGSRHIQTPIKSIELSQITQKTKLNKKIYGLNEIHKKLYEKTKRSKKGKIIAYSVDDLLQSPFMFKKFNQGLNNIYDMGDKKEFTMCFVEYEGEEYPNKHTIELMALIAHRYSDIIPLPIVTYLKRRFESNPSETNRYLDFLDRIYNEIDTMNDKPIMGIIPPLTTIKIKRIMDFYIKKNVRFFYFDFDGIYPESALLNIDYFLKRLYKEEILDESFIHSLNANMGKLSQKKNVIPTRDIMSFAYRFSSLGRYKGPKAGKDLEENRLRIFRKEDYGCYKVTSIDDLQEIYPKDSSIPMEVLYDSLKSEKIDYRSQKLFNMEQQGLESYILRKVITEQESKEYIKNKEYVDKTELRKIEKMRASLKSQTFLD